MTMRPAAVVLLVGLTQTAVGCGKKDSAGGGSPDDDMAALQGKWKIVKLEPDSTGGDDGAYKAAEITVAGDEVTLTFDAADPKSWGLKGTLKLDPKTLPREIDLIPPPDGGGKGTIRGIYKYEGDILVVALPFEPAEPRPTDFTPRYLEKEERAAVAVLHLKKQQ